MLARISRNEHQLRKHSVCCSDHVINQRSRRACHDRAGSTYGASTRA